MPRRPPKKLSAEALQALTDDIALSRDDPSGRVRKALDEGADPNQRDAGGQTLLWPAMRRGDASLLRLLLDAGADPDAVDTSGGSILAESAHSPEMVRALLDAGADVRRHGAAAFHAAAREAVDFAPARESLRLLVGAGVSPDCEVDGSRVLAEAATDATPARTRLLLALGADPTPGIFGASGAGNLKTLALLLAAGAKVNARDADGETALHHAATAGSAPVVRRLLAAGAKPDVTNRARETPLHAAASCGSAAAAKALLAAGAKVDATDADGAPALARAAASGYDALDPAVKALLAAGANPNRKDRAGRNALTLARLARRARAAAMLRRAGAREQAEFADAIAAVEAAAAEETARSAAAAARAVAYFEARHGPSGTGRIVDPELEGPGRGARRPDGKVAVWKAGHNPSYVVVVPAKDFAWDEGQRPKARGAPGAVAPARPAGERLARVREAALAADVTLRRGATEAALAKAEAAMGLRLPDEVRAWFALNDGCATSGAANGEDLLPLRDVVSVWRGFRGMQGEARGGEGRDGVRGVYWSPGWVPLMHDGGGDYACLDLDPAPGTAPGQVIRVWHDGDERPVLARSFLDWLEGIYWGAYG